MSVPRSNPCSSKAFKKLVSLTGEGIHEYSMISDGDRLLVGVSGGKDSLMLMHVLSVLQSRAPVKFDLVPVCFNPGFSGFNLEGLTAYFSTCGWSLDIVDFDVEAVLKEKNFENQPCVLCSRLRRGMLYGEADQRKCNKIVLGQHLDDICVSLMISLFRGHGVTTMGPNVPADSSSKRVIRPLALAPESLIIEAAILFQLPSCGDCLYKDQLKNTGDRAYFAGMLEALEQRIPNVRQCMLRSMSDLRPEFMLDRKFLDL